MMIPHIGQAHTSIIIPSAGRTRTRQKTPMLKHCLESLSSLNPAPREIVVVIGDEYEGEPADYLSKMPIRVVHRGPGPFDFSRAVNTGVLISVSQQVLILNDDTEAEGTIWLQQMADHLQDPNVGAVGALLTYPNAHIQHIGIEFEQGQPIHLCRGKSPNEVPMVTASEPINVGAATGACLLMRKNDFLTVGGMSPEFPVSYGDVDLCLRLRRCGFRVVVDPKVQLTHHESSSRPPIIEDWEKERFTRRWSSNFEQLLENPSTAPRAKPADLLDPSHEEIMRLRDQNIALAVQLEGLRSHIASLRWSLTEQENTLREWKDRVSERDTRIAERDTRIAERDNLLAEKNRQLEARLSNRIRRKLNSR
ncbi:MAG: glycosyltransferase [Acidimicrobiia bacterium]|nr:glycosyltransferase [Acidimicrobiia bacterium]